MPNDPTPNKRPTTDHNLYVQTYRGRMVANSDWFHYGPGVEQNVACDIASEADRELAEKEARIRELEGALQSTVTALATLVHPNALDNYMSQETQEWIIQVKDRDQ